MARHQVTCYTPDNNDSDRRIQGVGFNSLYYSLDEAIQFLRAAENSLYVSYNGIVSEVVESTSALGRPYLKTSGDGLLGNNILNLPVCNRS